MDVSSFADIEPEFNRRVNRIVWCTFTTSDAKGRLRSRMLHPIWEGPAGWIATGRNSHKAKHIAANPYVSLTYWDPQHEQVYAECRASWDDSQATKDRLYEMYRDAPPPLGYDLKMFWPAGANDPNLGALKLEPWRIELSSLGDMASGKPPMVWRPT